MAAKRMAAGNVNKRHKHTINTATWYYWNANTGIQECLVSFVYRNQLNSHALPTRQYRV